MASYWKSTPMYECKYCKCWMQDTAAQRKHHENGKRHKENVERSQLETSKRNYEREQDAINLKDTMQKIEEAALKAEGLPIPKKQKTGGPPVATVEEMPGPSVSNAPFIKAYGSGATTEQRFGGKQEGNLYTAADFAADHEWDQWNNARLKKLANDYKAQKQEEKRHKEFMEKQLDDGENWRDLEAVPKGVETSTGFGAWETVTVHKIDDQQEDQQQQQRSNVTVHVQEASGSLGDLDEEGVGGDHSHQVLEDPEERKKKESQLHTLNFDFGLKPTPPENENDQQEAARPAFEFKLKSKAGEQFEDMQTRQTRVLENSMLMGQSGGASLQKYLTGGKSGRSKPTAAGPAIVVPKIDEEPEPEAVAFKKNSARSKKRQFRKKDGD